MYPPQPYVQRDTSNQKAIWTHQFTSLTSPDPGHTWSILININKYQQRISPQRTPNLLNKHFHKFSTPQKTKHGPSGIKRQGNQKSGRLEHNLHYNQQKLHDRQHSNCTVCTTSIGCSSITPRHRNFYLNITQYPELEWKERIIIRNFVHQIW